MSRPAISVLIPVYNVEQWLGRCLDSVLGQSIDDFEIICVNDASPDGSMKILEEYSKRDKRIKIVDKEKNEGLMMARATGRKVAEGEYFFFLDSDDYLPEDALEKLLKAARETGADIVVGEMCLVNTHWRKVVRTRTKKCGTTSESYLRSMLNWNSPSLCGSLFSRKLFDGKEYSEILHQIYSEDRILLTEILLKNEVKVAAISDITYFYWMNTDSSTRIKITEKIVESQFSALFRSYDAVAEGRPDMEADNNNYIIRYMSLYIEKGAPMKSVRDFNAKSKKLLEFKEMRRWVGTRMAFHTWACMYLPGYRATTHGCRNIIRLIQGKD